jgi:hypothetical protein
VPSELGAVHHILERLPCGFLLLRHERRAVLVALPRVQNGRQPVVHRPTVVNQSIESFPEVVTRAVGIPEPLAIVRRQPQQLSRGRQAGEDLRALVRQDFDDAISDCLRKTRVAFSITHGHILHLARPVARQTHGTS